MKQWTGGGRRPVSLKHARELYVGGEWIVPASDATFTVDDSGTEEVFLEVAAAQPEDIDRAVAAARQTFDDGSWSDMKHRDRAEYLRLMARAIHERHEDLAQVWASETGIIYDVAIQRVQGPIADGYERYADLSDTFPFEKPVTPTAGGDHGIILYEGVGVVAAIIPWNAPLTMILHKMAPALLAGCTVIVKASPEAPGNAYLMAEIAEEIGLPAGVLNVVVADRDVSERLVRDPRVDKVSFTGSTAAGRRIAAICSERIARVTLELGGKSAAVVLDDYDIETAAQKLALAECNISGQVCSSLTRIIVTRSRHDALVEALADHFSRVRVGDPFDPLSEMGPLVSSQHRDRVLHYIERGIADGAILATGGGRPAHLDRGWYVEPTVFGNVDNASVIAQEEIFGPVLSVIPANDEADAIRIANDSIYGLNASVFGGDELRARKVGAAIRAGTVGINEFRTDLGVCFGGFKQSGLGREGGEEGLRGYLEPKTMIF